MKKILLFAAVLFVVAIGMNSCKSSEDCPAYGQAPTEQPAERA
ncbi:hypothetical protein [Carboxylicivirga linearis]|nr:hypothetical protein [Carboxylicivirga linearis]